MSKFVLGAIVGAVMIVGIIATCSDRLTVGKAEALEWNEFGANAVRAVNQPAYECDVNKTCVRWAYGWHPQHQRVNGEVKTVDVRGWKCVGWEFPNGGLIPACDNEIMTREAGR